MRTQGPVGVGSCFRSCFSAKWCQGHCTLHAFPFDLLKLSLQNLAQTSLCWAHTQGEEQLKPAAQKPQGSQERAPFFLRAWCHPGSWSSLLWKTVPGQAGAVQFDQSLPSPGAGSCLWTERACVPSLTLRPHSFLFLTHSPVWPSRWLWQLEESKSQCGRASDI